MSMGPRWSMTSLAAAALTTLSIVSADPASAAARHHGAAGKHERLSASAGSGRAKEAADPATPEASGSRSRQVQAAERQQAAPAVVSRPGRRFHREQHASGTESHRRPNEPLRPHQLSSVDPMRTGASGASRSIGAPRSVTRSRRDDDAPGLPLSDRLIRRLALGERVGGRYRRRAQITPFEVQAQALQSAG